MAATARYLEKKSVAQARHYWIGTTSLYNAGLRLEHPMKPLGTPHSAHAFRVLLLGSGELGKEVAIELQRFALA